MSKEKIIVALDVETADEARRIIRDLRDEVGAFKIGLQLFTAAGGNFVKEIVQSGVKVFLDLKFHDIPNTVAKASIEATRLGVWMFNVHALGGKEMMRRTVEEVREICAKEQLTLPKIIAVTVLTSSNEAMLREIGIESTPETEVLKLAKLTDDSGLDGVVASPQETGLIRKEVGKSDFLIVTPGVRPQFENHFYASPDDQKRVLSPQEAIKNGADFLVIGRPILKASDPVKAAQAISAEINSEV